MKLKKIGLLLFITTLLATLEACGGETFTGTDFGATVTQTENALFTPPILTAEDQAFFTVNDFLDSIRAGKLNLRDLRSFFTAETTDDTLSPLSRLAGRAKNPIFILQTGHLSYQLASKHQDADGNWILSYVIKNVGSADFEKRFREAYNSNLARGETMQTFISRFNLQESDFIRTAFSFTVHVSGEGQAGILIQKDQVEALARVLIPTLNFSCLLSSTKP